MNSGNRQQAEAADELKRKARRRLVGALVLFLTALIVVPAVIETGPERTKSDIELIVPPKPKTSSAITTLPPPEVQGKANLPPVPADAVTDPIDVAQQQANQSAQVAPKAPAQIAPAKNDEKKVEPKPTPKVEQKPEPKPAVPAKVEPAPPAKPSVAKDEVKRVDEDPIAKFAQAEQVYWVQVAALSDKARAEEMRGKLASQGFDGRLESVKTDVGVVYRVRVGPLSGLTKATEVKDRLKANGYNGRVVQ